MSLSIRIVSGAYEGIAFDIEEGQELKLGRSPNNDVILTHDSCTSGSHASLKVWDGRIFLFDFNSTNGSFLKGERIASSRYQEVDGFFVLGSTIFMPTDNPEPCSFLPLPQTSPEAGKWGRSPLSQWVSKTFDREPVIHGGHLFLGLLTQYEREIDTFFRNIGFPLDRAKLLNRVKTCKIFMGDLAWLNKSISLRAGLPRGGEPFLTPRVLSLLDSAGPGGDLNPDQLLSEFLSLDFNLAFPLIDWEKSRHHWDMGLQKIRTPENIYEDKEDPDASLSRIEFGMASLREFWKRIEQAHALNQLLVVTGSRGCGKTTALHLGFEKGGSPVLSPDFYKGARTFLDPKAFLFFNHSSKLSGYSWRAAELIGRNEFVVIDHFGELLLAMQQENIDRSRLLRAINQHKGPVILCAGKKNMEMVETQIGFVETLDLDRYLEPKLPEFYETFLQGFEKRIDMKLNTKARRFFLEKVAAVEPYNFGALKEFLILCAGRTATVDPSFSEQTTITRSMNELSETCFRDVYDEWVRAPQKRGSGADEARVLKQIEELFHQYAKHLFNVHLRYSDQTRHFDDPGRLSSRQKLEELKSNLVYMFSAFQSSFPAWFQDFWMKLDPEIIRVETGGVNNPKKLWQAYCERTKTIDADYAEDLFNETAARVFLETLRTKNTGGRNK